MSQPGAVGIGIARFEQSTLRDRATAWAGVPSAIFSSAVQRPRT
jgi:hypothetical protein